MTVLDKLTGASAAKLSDLNPLIDAINALGAKIDSVRADHDVLQAEISARQAENRLGSLEAYAQNNSKRIDAMELRYNAVVDEVRAVADSLEQAVADLVTTDEVSGWQQWKEQQREQGNLT